MQHVLIIEDESLLANCYRDMAMFAGASSVDVVINEDAAVEAAKRHPPTIIVSDVDLADGGTGPDAVMRIWALFGPIPVIFITGQPDDEAAKVFATAIIAKPCTAEQFARIFSNIATPYWNAALPDGGAAAAG